MVIGDLATQAVPDSVDLIQPLIDLFQPIFVKASLVVGGIFGVYLLLLIARVHYEKKKVRILKDIRFDLDQLNMYHGIKTSKQKRGFFGKIIDFFKEKSRDKKLEKEFGPDEEEKPEKKKHKKKHKHKK